MYDNGDILLFSLSAWRETPWTTFKKCFDEVHRRHAATAGSATHESAAIHRWRALRMLSSLGHIDLRIEHGAISILVAPAVLAALPGFGVRKAVLCGARSPSIMAAVLKAAALAGARATTRSQVVTSPFAPTRIEIEADADKRIQAIADTLGIPYLNKPPARYIASIPMSTQDYCLSLAWSSEDDLNWHREDFDIEDLRFGPRGEEPQEARLSRYQDPSTSLWRYRLWRKGQFAEVDPDWGRYAILEAHSKRVLTYDAEHRDVLVPIGTPLPGLLARALGLCSGHSPSLTNRPAPASTGRVNRCEVFKGVPPSIFKLVATAVGQCVPVGGVTWML